MPSLRFRKAETYIHTLFDQHEITFSNAAPTESLHTGAEALRSVGRDAHREIRAIFSQIMRPEFRPETVRPVPKTGTAMQTFTNRINQNNKQALEI